MDPERDGFEQGEAVSPYPGHVQDDGSAGVSRQGCDGPAGGVAQRRVGTRGRRRVLSLVAALSSVCLVASCTAGNERPVTPEAQTSMPSDGGGGADRGRVGLSRQSVQGPWSMAMLDDMPLRRSPLPPRLDLGEAAAAPSLIDAPVERAVFIARNEIFTGDETRLRDGDFVIRSTAGAWRTLSPADLGAIDPNTERSFSVSPGGGLLAFSDREAILVVDVRSGSVRRLDVPFAEPIGLAWTPDERFVLASDRHAREERPVLVDARSGQVKAVPYSIFDTVFSPSGTAVELHVPDRGQRSKGHYPELRTYTAFGTFIGSTPLRLPGVTEKDPAVSRFAAVVRGGPGRRAGITVVNRRSGQPLAHLAMQHPTHPARSWLTLHGWTAPHTLLIGDGWGKGDGGFLMTWNWKTRKLHRISRFPSNGGIDSDVATDLL